MSKWIWGTIGLVVGIATTIFVGKGVRIAKETLEARKYLKENK